MRMREPFTEVFPIKVLIVDDEPLARDRLRQLLEGDDEVEVVGEAGCGHDAVAAIKSLAPNLIFLDVQMPEMDGFGVLEALETEPRLPMIIFVTAFNQHALRAFEVSALDYLLKPYERERFEQALRRAKEALKQAFDSQQQRRIFAMLERLKGEGRYLDWLSVKVDERVLLLRVSEIDWIEAEGNYVRVHIGKQTHFLRETISGLEEQLDPKTFIRTQRGAIVNVNRIRELHVWTRGDYRIVLHDGAELTLSRHYRENLDVLLNRPL
ncbi:MAG TPA: LytTR family DNA-binding domain-containing protein [Blastocatellia bacterium]|nr:LytTR family DNA-binding domain-containing protein [Blastocatellia bacterium]